MLQEAERSTKTAHPDSIELAKLCLYARFVGDRVAGSSAFWILSKMGSTISVWPSLGRHQRSFLAAHCIRSPMVREAWWQLLKTQPLLGAQATFISHMQHRRLGQGPPLLSHLDPPGPGGLTGIGRRAWAISVAAL